MSQGGMSDEARELDANQSSRTDGERLEGRPSDAPPATPADTGRPDPVRETSTQTSGASGAPEGTEGTIAPEEKGAEPETEHAPGSDL